MIKQFKQSLIPVMATPNQLFLSHLFAFCHGIMAWLKILKLYFKCISMDQKPKYVELPPNVSSSRILSKHMTNFELS